MAEAAACELRLLVHTDVHWSTLDAAAARDTPAVDAATVKRQRFCHIRRLTC